MIQTKKEISKYIHRLIKQGNLKEAERFLKERLDSGERDTIILGSLINVYKLQRGHWEDIETLSREYLKLKPNNSFAKKSLELAQKRGKNRRKKDTDIIDFTEKSEDNIQGFRRKIYDGEITIANLSNDQLRDFTEFERTLLLSELYSHSKMPIKAVELLKKANNIEGVTVRQKKIIAQAIQLANSTKMGFIQKRTKWRNLSEDKGREK